MSEIRNKNRENSLALKNLEIWDKVTDSQTVASRFGGVGRTDSLFSRSQTEEQEKKRTITNTTHLYNRITPTGEQHSYYKLYQIKRYLKQLEIYFFPSCCCRCCSWIPSTAWWKLKTRDGWKGPSGRGQVQFKSLNEETFTHQCGHGQKSLIYPPILVILHARQHVRCSIDKTVITSSCTFHCRFPSYLGCIHVLEANTNI